MSSRYWVLLALTLIVGFTAVVRLRLLDFPLERDEGEYAYMGQLLLDGVPPYAAAYNMKFPGIYAAYALVMAMFGQTAAGIHFGVLLVNLAALVLVFFLTRRLWDSRAGLMAAATYAVLTMSHKSFAMAGHATHFVVLPVLAAVFLMLKAAENPRVWKYGTAGLLMGLAVLMKQPAAVFAVFGGLFILWTGLCQNQRQWAATGIRLGAFALGVMVPLGVTALLLWHVGVFDKFWFWTVVYARAYGSQITLHHAPQVLASEFRSLVTETWPLWALSGLGLVLLLLSREGRRRLPFVVGFALFSFLAVCPGFYFRNHYFIMLMPVVAMAVGGGLSSLCTGMERQRMFLPAQVCWLLFLGTWGYVVYQDREFLLFADPEEACRITYDTHPFVEAQVVAEYIKSHTRLDETIAVLGSEPEIYFYSHRRSATGHIYVFALMEAHKNALAMQEEMTREIDNSNPRYIVHISSAWVSQQVSVQHVFDWFDKKLPGYELVGIVDIERAGSKYRWDAEVGDGRPMSADYITIRRRK